MSKKIKLAAGFFVALFVVLVSYLYLHRHSIAVFNPAGVVASKERNLIILTLALSLIVIIPVFIMLFGFAWKYRASNTKARYQPDFDHHRGLEFLWWAIPCLIISILGVITWQATHALDPYRPLYSSKKPVTIQVIAMDWKWLFLYPDQKVASVNYFRIPVGTPINFEITSDAPMNSFWIPNLSGQIYAMSGMSTSLHIMASKMGSYRGLSANISGDGFSGMTFTAQATSAKDFNSWVNVARLSGSLGQTAYDKLAVPSKNNPVTTYGLTDSDLYNKVIMKYMMPAGNSQVVNIGGGH